MEKLIALIGLLFFMFLVLAASVEVMLEACRGALEFVGFKWVKGKVSLDDALKLATEFAPNNTELYTKLEAVRSAALQVQTVASEKLQSLNAIGDKLKELQPNADTSQIAAEINAVAATIKTDLEASESRRIFVLRFIAAVLGCVLVWQADFYVFRMLATAPEAKEYLSTLQGLQVKWVNILVGGLAAAAGSSYWHDQLDKVRNLKAVVAETKKLAP